VSAVIERDCAEHIHWHPYSTIEKYSPDQTRWAERRLREALRWRRLPLLNHVPLGENRATLRRHQATGLVHDLHGNWLRELFPGGPEDGLTYDDGNLMVSVGLTQVINMLTGAAQSGTVRYLTNAQTVVGVGTNTAGSGAPAAIGDTALKDDNSANAYYQGSDATFPSLTGPATINNQCTFASGNANFAWNEWCWATGQTITAGTHLATGAVFATLASMINHKTNLSSGGGASLGTKGSGASWVFSTTIVFS
jgi:hypothetical protein